MKNQKIFIACDSSNVNQVKKIIKHTSTNKIKIGYKFGFEFFYSKKGRAFISKLKRKEVFLDLKINDIPNTSASAILSLKDLRNISYLTVHISGGYEMLKAVKKVPNPRNSTDLFSFRASLMLLKNVSTIISN